MKTTTINEARELPANMPISRITGKIKLIWERKTGTNANGDWSMQTGYLTEGENEIKFTLSGLPDLSNDFAPNDMIVFRCKESPKGLSGVKIKIDTFKGKSEPVLWITPSALICGGTEEPDELEGLESNGEKEPSATSTPKPQQSAPKANVERPVAIPEDGIKEVKRRLMQFSNFRALCDAAVDHLYGEGASDEMKKDVSSCFFISGLREGLEKKLPNNKPNEKVVEKKMQLTEEHIAKEDIKF